MSERGEVLKQRVIALTGAPEKTVSKPQIAEADMSRTMHEWGTRERERVQAAAEPAPSAAPAADAQWATYSSISLELCDDLRLSQRIFSASVEDAVTQQFDPNIAPRSLPVVASLSDLATIAPYHKAADALKEQAPDVATPHTSVPAPPAAAPSQPRMILVPASVVWTVSIALAISLLALTLLVLAFVLHSQFGDAISVRALHW